VFTPDGTRVAAPSLAQSGVHQWGVAEGVFMRTLGNHEHVRSIAFSSDGSLLATGGDDRTAQVWDARTGAHRQTLRAGRMVPAWPLAFSPDGQRLAVANFGSNSVSLWDTESLGRTGRTDVKSGAVTAVAFDPSGELVISGGTDGRIELDTVDGASVRDLKPHVGEVHAIACSADGKVFATGGADGLVKVVALVTGEELQSLSGHAGEVFAVAFSRDSQRIASGGGDGTVRIWQRH
jgi:WD40 repeat protein